MSKFLHKIGTVGMIPIIFLVLKWTLDWPLFDFAHEILGGWIWAWVGLFFVGLFAPIKQ